MSDGVILRDIADAVVPAMEPVRDYGTIGGTAALLVGDALERLRELPSGIARTCVTSPPYYGQRDYGDDRQLGSERQLGLYVEKLVLIFREVRRVLTPDGTLWLNLGDTYANTAGRVDRTLWERSQVRRTSTRRASRGTRGIAGFKRKDLMGVPWEVALALRDDGWWLRNDIVWEKPNCAPESVKDRLTRSHEMVFLLSKSQRYFFDIDAISEPVTNPDDPGTYRPVSARKGGEYRPPGQPRRGASQFAKPKRAESSRRRKRDVWSISTKPFKGDHYAAFPPELAMPPVLAGAAAGDIVLDPFCGSGTTGMVALHLGRRFVGIELVDKFAGLAWERINNEKTRTRWMRRRTQPK